MYGILEKEKWLNIIITIIWAHFGKIKTCIKAIRDKAKIIKNIFNSLLFGCELSAGTIKLCVQCLVKAYYKSFLSFSFYFILEKGLM